MANKINYQRNPIFQFTELTPKEYETMPEEGLYLLRCKLPEDDWACICKEDMKSELSGKNGANPARETLRKAPDKGS